MRKNKAKSHNRIESNHIIWRTMTFILSYLWSPQSVKLLFGGLWMEISHCSRPDAGRIQHNDRPSGKRGMRGRKKESSPSLWHDELAVCCWNWWNVDGTHLLDLFERLQCVCTCTCTWWLCERFQKKSWKKKKKIWFICFKKFQFPMEIGEDGWIDECLVGWLVGWLIGSGCCAACCETDALFGVY